MRTAACSWKWSLGVLGTLLIVATGCSPDTRYRRSALVPSVAALQWDGRTAPRGALRLEGAVSTVGVTTDLISRPGDTAVHVPRVRLDGAAALAVTGGLELGARYSYGAYAWSKESAIGTVPIPSGSAVTGFGPELRGTIRLDDEGMFALGLGANYLFYSVPTAEWERDPTCIGSSSPSCFEDVWTDDSLVVGYRLQHEDNKSVSALALALYPSVAPARGKYGHIFFGVSAHTDFKNDGFSDDANGAPVETSGFVPFFGAGYGIKIDAFRASAMLNYPFASSPVNYDPLSGFLTIGADIPLWGGREADSGGPATSAPAAAPR